jgi:DNA polymerase
MMEGFFSEKEIKSISRPDGKSLSCVSCGLYKDCQTGKMQKPYGKFKKKILIVGEAPGEKEDEVNRPWQGRAGRLLSVTLTNLGIDLFGDCTSINAVNCRPMDKNGENRPPTNFEVDCCRKYVMRAIEDLKPELIILLGTSAVYSVIGHRWKKDLGTITRWRGWTIPDQDFKAWICPTFHPSYILRTIQGKSPSKVESVIWEQDLKKAFTLGKHSFPVHKEPKIHIIEDLSILAELEFYKPVMEDLPCFAFDYETTGIKPHAEDHRIICASIAINENEAYVFLMPPTKRERQPFVDLLVNPEIGKIAQNMKYENAWSKVRLKIDVESWVWDTMIASHIFDNRQKITGLKFQVYVQFGIIDYSSEVDVFIHASDPKNSNSMNKILDMLQTPSGKEKFLKYCGYDSIYEYRLAVKQMENFLPF